MISKFGYNGNDGEGVLNVGAATTEVRLQLSSSSSSPLIGNWDTGRA